MSLRIFFSREFWSEFFIKYERAISSGALLLGFIVDNFTLQRIDLAFENIVLLFYIFLSAGSIAIINFVDERKFTTSLALRARRSAPYIMQYAFGGLFSGFFIFYSRSATLSASWPFLLFLVALLIGNEKFRDRYSRFTFQIGILFITLYSFMIFSVPIVIGKMGAWVFLLSGIMALICIGVFLVFLRHIVQRRIEENKRILSLTIGGVFVIMNVLYFTNIIPPIPLSLKSAGVYHNVTRTAEGNYRVTEEGETWYEWLTPGRSITLSRGESVSVFTAVFAPTRLNTDIKHVWFFYDEKNNAWQKKSDIRFSIAGGRDGGYRGYTVKSAPAAGKWRVDITTTRGQIVGRVKFTVKHTESSEVLVTREL